ncbi:hypothetical protein PsYK624_081660 [Phanerochaete sordida]|uniref:Fungal-type protein kinase domain-containing protein n=1 Tax=Phanerochaete sordida TaxID=48140 RepID=A0A9P3G9S0_9APHY|nr:hypothetical protein PsYK624_081660 [Phanerochaete sordida]
MDMPRPLPVQPRLRPEYSTVETDYTEDCVALSKTLNGYWVGLMPLDEMFRTFFPGIPVPPCISCPDYTKVKPTSGDLDMHKSWTTATLDGTLPQHVTLSSSSDPRSSKCHPDVAVQLYGAEQTPSIVPSPPPFSTLDIACAVEDSNSPFLFQRRTGRLEYLETPQGGQIRGRLAHFAKQHFQQQHRISLWQIVLNIKHRQAHLIHWDRAGAVVSEGFDPLEDPWIFRLAWAYSRASRRQQGFDNTALLWKHQNITFQSAISRYLTQCKDRLQISLPAAREIRKSSSPIYRLDVPDEQAADGVRPCLVAEPFYTAHSPLGRGTRVFVAYDLVDRAVRIVKDSWRPEYPNALPEHVALTRMAEAGVEHIPKFICGGDVAEAPGEPVQATVTQDLGTGAETAAWRLPCAPRTSFRKLVHYRILEDITLPLEKLKDSRELLIVIRDIAKAIRQARRRAQLMHCDVTWFNIRWEYDAIGNIRGVLIDWDHAERLPFPFVFNPDAPNASATWHFMPIRVMNDRQTVRQTVDDLESLYWSLLFGSLRFVKHNSPFTLFGDRDFFSSPTGCIPLDQSRFPIFINAKQGFLSGERLTNVRWQSSNFQEFMQELTDEWARYYRLWDAERAFHQDDAVCSDEWNAISLKMNNAQWLIDKIDETLEKPSSGWMPGDIGPNQFEKLPAKDIPVLQDVLTSASTLDASHMSVDPASGMRSMAPHRFADPRSQSLMDLAMSSMNPAKSSMNVAPSSLRKRSNSAASLEDPSPGPSTAAQAAEHGRSGAAPPTKMRRADPASGSAGASSAKTEPSGSRDGPGGIQIRSLTRPPAPQNRGR